MKTVKESDKLSLSECRKILSVNGVNYTDEQILKIRNWLYRFAEISLTLLEGKSKEEKQALKNKLLGKEHKK